MTEVKITLQPKQKEFRKAVENNSVVFYGGSKGGGKSHALRNILLIRRFEHPGTKGLLVRRTYDELIANHIDMLYREQPELMGKYYAKGDKTLYLPNKSIIRFRHLQHPKDVYNYQGQEYEDIAIDELTQHTKEVFNILRTSNRTTIKGVKPKFFAGGNPGGIGHAWCKKLFINREFEFNEKPEDYSFVSAKVYDNKALMDNDPAYLERLRALPEVLRKAYLDGDWDIFEGQFFAEWNIECHIINPYKLDIKFKRFICGDYGYSKPSAIYWCAIDFNGKVIVYRELYEKGLTYEQLGRKIVEMTPQEEKIDYAVFDPSLWGTDSATGLTGEMLVRRGGLTDRNIPLFKADNKRNYGWGVMRDFLKLRKGPYGKDESGIVFFKTCYNAIRTIPEQIFDAIRVEDLDTEGDDHCSDSVRYGLVSRVIRPSDPNKEVKKEETKEEKWFKERMKKLKRMGLK